MTDPGVLLVRQADGRAAAFLNRCRHRRRPVVIESHGDSARGFICPFHAWRYGLDGDLAYAPRHDWPEPADGWPGLHRLRVIEANGLILAATEQDAGAAAVSQAPAAALAGLQAAMRDDIARSNRSDMRTEIDLPRVLSLALATLAGASPTLAPDTNEPGARSYVVDRAARLSLIAPGTFVWQAAGTVTMLRVRVLRRGGCEVQAVALGEAAKTGAERVAHALQESSADAPPEPVAEIAAAFALPEA